MFRYNFFGDTCCSEAESVVSEATTAVVSDTDRYAQVVGERSGTSRPSPGESISLHYLRLMLMVWQIPWWCL